MAKFTVASEEGAQRYAAEVGADVELRLDPDEERAVVAAGWITPEKKQKEAK